MLNSRMDLGSCGIDHVHPKAQSLHTMLLKFYFAGTNRLKQTTHFRMTLPKTHRDVAEKGWFSWQEYCGNKQARAVPGLPSCPVSDLPAWAASASQGSLYCARMVLLVQTQWHMADKIVLGNSTQPSTTWPEWWKLEISFLCRIWLHCGIKIRA